MNIRIEINIYKKIYMCACWSTQQQNMIKNYMYYDLSHTLIYTRKNNSYKHDNAYTLCTFPAVPARKRATSYTKEQNRKEISEGKQTAQGVLYSLLGALSQSCEHTAIASSFSSSSSRPVNSSFPRANASTLSPCTIFHCLPEICTGNENTMSFGTP